LDTVLLSHFEVLSVVLVSTRVDNNLVTRDLVVQELGKGHSLEGESFIRVAGLSQAEAFKILTTDEQVVLLLGMEE